MEFVEENDCWCDNCDDYTTQLRKYDTHERDSSHNHFVCLKCKWECFGSSDVWRDYSVTNDLIDYYRKSVYKY